MPQAMLSPAGFYQADSSAFPQAIDRAGESRENISSSPIRALRWSRPMPSPFPGMDPYLESRDWFPCLHDSLITFIMESLQARLPETYYAQSSQRIWLEYSRRYVEPD